MLTRLLSRQYERQDALSITVPAILRSPRLYLRSTESRRRWTRLFISVSPGSRIGAWSRTRRTPVRASLVASGTRKKKKEEGNEEEEEEEEQEGESGSAGEKEDGSAGMPAERVILASNTFFPHREDGERRPFPRCRDGGGRKGEEGDGGRYF